MDTVFFWASKLVWMLINPFNLFFILLLITVVLFWVDKSSLARNLLSLLVGVLFIIAFFPVGEWLLYPLETRFKTNPELLTNIDGIVVLSGAESPTQSTLWHQVELGAAAERNTTFVELAGKYPHAKLVFTGGSSSLLNQEYKSADVAKMLFKNLGMDESRISYERNARNTFENAVFTKKMINPGTAENWLLITSASHMPRSVGVFCKLGWPVIPYPVDHMTMKGNILRLEFALAGHMGKLGYAIKEWIGLLVYYLTGKTSSLFPSVCAE